MDANRHTKDKLVENGPSARSLGSSMLSALTAVASLLTIVPFVANVSSPPQAAAVTPFSLPAPITPTPQPVPSYAASLTACKLEQESISATVSGYTARVTVKQRFRNPNHERMDGKYTFPLSDTCAVDSMTMTIGARVIKGAIRPAQQARQIYDLARSSGFTASLLEQQRTNIFEQSVANVQPNEAIDITLSYTEMVPYEHGQFSLVFPTSIGSRFTPAYVESPTGTAGTAPDRLSVDVAINEGTLPIVSVASPSHPFAIESIDGSHAKALWNSSAQTPGKDIVLNWKVAGGELQTGYLTHKQGKDGFLTAMIMPPNKLEPTMIAPREMIFIVDCSGSQDGPPLQKAKETLNYIVDRMSPEDTFQILAFNTNLRTFAPEPQHVSDSMKLQAHSFINSLQADGGTVMVPAIEAACSAPARNNNLRIVTLMTDGFIGNDYEVIGLVKRWRGKSRWFPFGTGNSVNRTLIDGIAREGGGEPEFVMLDSSGQKVAEGFYQRIAAPVLTDVSVSAEGFQLEDVYPKQISDVWEQKPLYFQARYAHAGSGTLVVRGHYQGKDYTQRLRVQLPEVNAENDAIAQIWARQRIDELMSRDWGAMHSRRAQTDVVNEIIKTSIDYHVLSQFTAFVAVDSAMFQADLDKQVTAPKEDLAQRPLPPMNTSYQLFSPTNVVCGAGAVALVAVSRSGIRIGPAAAIFAVGAGVTTVFGFARGALQSTLSQSFSTVVMQMNSLNSYSASGSGLGGSYGGGLGGSCGQGASFSSSNSYTNSAACNTYLAPSYASSGTKAYALPAGPAPAASLLPEPGYDPYTLHLELPLIGDVPLDLQAGALLLQWLFFGAALVLLPLTAKARASSLMWRNSAFGACLVFVSVNLPNTLHWVIECAHRASLV